jgi:hypothetical protein
MAFGGQTVKGTSITLLDSTPKLMPDSAVFHGRMYRQYCEYEAAALTAGSYIAMARLPKGAVVMGGRIYCDPLGAAMAVTVGDSDDTDRFMTSVVATQGIGTQNGVDCGRFNAIDGIGYQYTCEKDILVSPGDATTATGTIKLVIEYGLAG